MSRYSRAASPADREFQQHMKQALRALEGCLDVCGRVARQRQPERVAKKEARQLRSEEVMTPRRSRRDLPKPRVAQEIRVETRRAKDTLRKLQQVRGVLASIGSLAPGYDRADQDLLPEGLRTPESRRQARKEREAAALKKKKEAAEAAQAPLPLPLPEEAVPTHPAEMGST